MSLARYSRSDSHPGYRAARYRARSPCHRDSEGTCGGDPCPSRGAGVWVRNSKRTCPLVGCKRLRSDCRSLVSAPEKPPRCGNRDSYRSPPHRNLRHRDLEHYSGSRDVDHCRSRWNGERKPTRTVGRYRGPISQWSKLRNSSSGVIRNALAARSRRVEMSGFGHRVNVRNWRTVAARRATHFSRTCPGG